MEQKYTYLSPERRAVYNDLFTDVLDLLKQDVSGEWDETFDEKKTCLEIFKRYLKDKILTSEDYRYLFTRVRDFYDIYLPTVYIHPASYIFRRIWEL